jgi:hypothetical protein
MAVLPYVAGGATVQLPSEVVPQSTHMVWINYQHTFLPEPQFSPVAILHDWWPKVLACVICCLELWKCPLLSVRMVHKE